MEKYLYKMHTNSLYLPLSSSGYDNLLQYLLFCNYGKGIYSGLFHGQFPHLDYTAFDTTLITLYVFIKLQFFILNWHNCIHNDRNHLDEYLEEILGAGWLLYKGFLKEAYGTTSSFFFGRLNRIDDNEMTRREESLNFQSS